MYVIIMVGPIKIFIEYVGANMRIQVPLLVIDRRCVSIMSTYIVLEPIGSARLTFDDDLYYELCVLMIEVCSESRMRSHM